MSIFSLMNNTVNILTETQTKSAAGYTSAPVLTTVATNVPCRVQELKPNEAIQIYGKYDAVKQKRVYFASNPNISSIGSWIQWNGNNYVVVNVQNLGGNINRLWEVDILLKANSGN